MNYSNKVDACKDFHLEMNDSGKKSSYADILKGKDLVILSNN